MFVLEDNSAWGQFKFWSIWNRCSRGRFSSFPKNIETEKKIMFPGGKTRHLWLHVSGTARGISFWQFWTKFGAKYRKDANYSDIESHELLILKLEWTFKRYSGGQRPEAGGRGEVNQSCRQGGSYKFPNLQPGGDTNGGGSSAIARATPLTSIITNALLSPPYKSSEKQYISNRGSCFNDGA